MKYRLQKIESGDSRVILFVSKPTEFLIKEPLYKPPSKDQMHKGTKKSQKYYRDLSLCEDVQGSLSTF